MAPVHGPPDVRVSITVDRPASQVWRAVADPARMARWSPETTEVLASEEAPVPVGTRFSGSNRRGSRSWSTSCRVVESTPSQAFAFDVTYGPLAVSRWRYVVSPDPAGCVVEEQWWDLRGRLMTFLSQVGTGVRDRAEHNRITMGETLRALKADLESEPPQPG